MPRLTACGFESRPRHLIDGSVPKQVLTSVSPVPERSEATETARRCA
jgi:hypothetical protein